MKKYNLNKFLLFVLTFTIIVGPRIKVLSTYIDTMRVLNIILFILFVLSFLLKKVTNINKYIGYILILLIFQLIYNSTLVIGYRFKDLTALKITMLSIINLCSSIYLINLYKKTCGYEANNQIMKNLIIIFFIDSLFTILAYFYKPLWKFGYEFLGHSNSQVFKILDTFEIARRSFDIGIGSGALTSMVFTSFFIICLILYYETRDKLALIIGMSILIATSLLGRTGLYIELLYSIVFLLFIILKKKKKKFIFNKRGSIRIISYFMTIVSAFIIFTTNIMQKFINITLPWVMESFINLSKYGKFSSNTTNELQGMYFLPQDLEILLFGSANFGRTKQLEYIPSDVGYVLIIFGVGVVGLILFLMPIIYMLYISIKNYRNIYSKMLFFILFNLILMNIKELFTLSTRGYSTIVFILIQLSINKAFDYSYKSAISK